LIELALVMALIGILAAVAYGVIRVQVFKSRRIEAITGLDAIHKAQLTYRSTTGSYGDDFDTIGFTLEGGVRIDARTIQGRYYVFTVQALSQDGVPAANFQALATGDIDTSDEVLDILMIENQLTVLQ
jgi:type II secretory pathway pseudopilin PulG